MKSNIFYRKWSKNKQLLHDIGYALWGTKRFSFCFKEDVIDCKVHHELLRNDNMCIFGNEIGRIMSMKDDGYTGDES